MKYPRRIIIILLLIVFAYRLYLNENQQIVQSQLSDAQAHYDRGNFQAALKGFTQVINSDPEWAVGYANRGAVYNRLEQYNNAINDFDHAIMLDPQLTNAYVNRGLAYYYLGNYQQAITDADYVLELNPNYADAYMGRALAYEALGYYVSAINDYYTYVNLAGSAASPTAWQKINYLHSQGY